MASHGSNGTYGRLQNAFQLKSWLINNSSSLRRREFPSTRANMHSTSLFKHVSAIHALLVILTSRPCQSSLARALLPASCRVFICSGARRTSKVHFLSGLILARRLTTPQLPPGSNRPRIPELSGARRQLALVGSSCITDWTSLTSSVFVGSTPTVLSVSRSDLWRRLSTFCCHQQHGATMVSATTRSDHCAKWLLPSVRPWLWA